MKQNFSAVIFDLDGTLIDSLMDIADAMNRTLTFFNYPTFNYSEYKYLVGNGLRSLVYKCLPIDRRDDKNTNEVLTVMMKEYKKSYADKTILYAGVPTLLDALTNKKIKLSVLSNKADSLTQMLADKLLAKWKFEVILGATDQFSRKPSPEAALFIAEQVKILPKNTLYIGDTNVDMQTANAAGMYAVGVTWGFRERKELEDNGAKQIIDHPMDLMKYV